MTKVTSYGFEKEFFFVAAPGRKNEGQITFVPDGIQHLADGCGYLLEARGASSTNPSQARWNLLEAERILAFKAADNGLVLENLDRKDIPKEHLRLCLRRYGKKGGKSYFANGKVYNNSDPRAGLHVHFGTQRTVTLTTPDYVRNDAIVRGQTQTMTVAELCNMPRIIFLLDRAFKEEIKKAKRVAGEYELKSHGFEYRSLPATVDISKVVDVLESFEKDE